MYYILYGCMVSNLLIVCKRMHSQRMQMWFRTTVHLDETDLVPRLYVPTRPNYTKHPQGLNLVKSNLITYYLLKMLHCSIDHWYFYHLVPVYSIHCNFALELLLKKPPIQVAPLCRECHVRSRVESRTNELQQASWHSLARQTANATALSFKLARQMLLHVHGAGFSFVNSLFTLHLFLRIFACLQFSSSEDCWVNFSGRVAAVEQYQTYYTERNGLSFYLWGGILGRGTIDLNELKRKYQKLQGLSLLFSLS